MRNLIVLFLLLSSSQIFAQEPYKYIPYDAYSAGEINFAAKRGEFMPSASFNNFSRGQFKIGFGFRLTSFFAKNKTYITAPAIYTSGKTGPSVFFADQIPQNIDTIVFKRPKGVSLNVAILLEYSFNQNWSAGFNIDAFGLTVAPKTVGKYRDLEQQDVSAKPTFFNALLISDNDRGSLNSELYVKYFMTDNPYFFKAGASFYFNEQKTLKKQRLGNDRFRYKSLAPVIGVGWIIPPPLLGNK
jgi:hypothetical protein